MSISIMLGLAPAPSLAVVGSAVVGSTLRLGPVDLVGASPLTFSVQWLRNGNAISGATFGAYTSKSADIGKDISARVTFPDGSTLVSQNAVLVQPEAPAQTLPVFTAAPTVAPATAAAGTPFTFTLGSASGQPQPTLTGTLTLNGIDVTNQMSGLSYTPTADGTLQWQVIAENAAGLDTRVIQASVATQTGGDVAPAFTQAPSVSPAGGSVGTTFTFTEGSATGTPAPQMVGTLTLDGVDVTAQMVGLSYTATQGGALVWSVRASNSAGSAVDTASVSVTAGQAATFDLATPSSAIRFPVNNNYEADLPGQGLVLRQPMDPWFKMFDPAQPDAFFAIARLPMTKRLARNETLNANWSLWGGIANSSKAAFIQLRSRSTGLASVRDVLRIKMGNIQKETPVVDEDAFLVVGRRDEDNKLIAEWYSLIDGTRHASGVAVGSTAGFWKGSTEAFSIGGGAGTTPPASGNDNKTKEWPGDISVVGWFRGPTTVADWQAIALGADPLERLGAENMAYYRALDGTPAGLAAPAAATGDLTPPLTVWGGTLEPGTDFRAQSQDTALLFDRFGGGDGHVFGLVPGEASRPIPISGRAAGHTGTVQVSLVYAETGEVLLDWTDVGPIAAGVWSGTVTAPKSSKGWVFAVARTTGAPDAVVQSRDRFGIGYKFLQLGQSQTTIYLNSHKADQTLSNPERYSASFASTDWEGTQKSLPGQFRPIGPVLDGEGGVRHDDGLSLFLEQFRHFDASTPVMVIDAAVSGTGPDQLISDDRVGRDWDNLQDALDIYGNDITVVLMNWATQGWNINNGPAPAEMMQALIDGTWSGTAHFPIDHSLATALRPGFVLALSPASRHAKGVHEAVRPAQIAYAQDRGLPIGPPVSDFRLGQDAVHQDGGTNANRVFGVRQAIAAARALGLDTSQQPHFSGTASFAGGGSQIVIPTVLPNGGTLSSPAPNALSSFEVQDGGSGAWTGTGFTAAIAGTSVELTKASGTWSAGTRVRHSGNGRLNVDGDKAVEDQIVAGMLYESWDTDVLGLGMPLMGMISNGRWVTGFSATVSP